MSQPTVPYQPVTWDEIVAAEPSVLDLIDDARAVAREAEYDRHFCRDRAWKFGYKSRAGFKPRLGELVGWASSHKGTRLGRSAPWDMVADKIMELLPKCRQCG